MDFLAGFLPTINSIPSSSQKEDATQDRHHGRQGVTFADPETESENQWFNGGIRWEIPSLKLTFSPLKIAYFQVRTVSFRKGNPEIFGKCWVILVEKWQH